MTFTMILISLFILGFLVQARLDAKPARNGKPRIQDSTSWRWIQQCLSVYLLVRVGLVGGSQVSGETGLTMALPFISAVFLSLFMMVATLLLLRNVSTLDRETRISLAAHYGSVSIGTFAVVSILLQNLRIPFAPYVTAWVALMEFPAILLAILFLGQGVRGLFALIREDKMIMILPASFVLGVVAGEQVLSGWVATAIFQSAFEPILAVFLFQMGCKAGTHIKDVRQHQWLLILLGILLPILGGTLGAATGRLLGLGLGETAILATLTASASYVAAPTSMTSAILALRRDPRSAEQAVSISLAASLGMTLPFNIMIGIHLYLSFSEWYENRILAISALTGVGLILILAALWAERKGGPVSKEATGLQQRHSRAGKVLPEPIERHPSKTMRWGGNSEPAGALGDWGRPMLVMTESLRNPLQDGCWKTRDPDPYRIDGSYRIIFVSAKPEYAGWKVRGP